MQKLFCASELVATSTLRERSLDVQNLTSLSSFNFRIT